jgi:hypothetical protein
VLRAAGQIAEGLDGNPREALKARVIRKATSFGQCTGSNPQHCSNSQGIVVAGAGF